MEEEGNARVIRRARTRASAHPYADKRKKPELQKIQDSAPVDVAPAIVQSEGVMGMFNHYFVKPIAAWIFSGSSQREQDLLEDMDEEDSDDDNGTSFQGFTFGDDNKEKENVNLNGNRSVPPEPSSKTAAVTDVRKEIENAVKSGRKFTPEDLHYYTQKLKDASQGKEVKTADGIDTAPRKRALSPTNGDANKRQATQSSPPHGQPAPNRSFPPDSSGRNSRIISVGAGALTTTPSQPNATRMLQSLDRLKTPLYRARKLYAPTPSPSPYVSLPTHQPPMPQPRLSPSKRPSWRVTTPQGTNMEESQYAQNQDAVPEGGWPQMNGLETPGPNRRPPHYPPHGSAFAMRAPYPSPMTPFLPHTPYYQTPFYGQPPLTPVTETPYSHASSKHKKSKKKKHKKDKKKERKTRRKKDKKKKKDSDSESSDDDVKTADISKKAGASNSTPKHTKGIFVITLITLVTLYIAFACHTT